uniref:TNF superfamily member 12 n=1 Tax=Anolis carolinensis TaxID=28377 RepID=A0A803T6P8_ANOCA
MPDEQSFGSGIGEPLSRLGRLCTRRAEVCPCLMSAVKSRALAGKGRVRLEVEALLWVGPASPPGVSCLSSSSSSSAASGKGPTSSSPARPRSLSFSLIPPPPAPPPLPPPPPPPRLAASASSGPGSFLSARPGAMGRQRRSRDPPARLVLLALALASGSALLLASLSLLLAAWPRSGARLLQHQDPAAPVPQVAVSTGWNSQGKFLHHLAQQGALRQRRQAGKGKRSRPRRPSAVSAAHYEDANGTIHGWAEAKLNTTSPLRYDRGRREFTVVKRGLYYLYCQVHFNEGKTIYMKLDVMLDGELALRCLEQFPPTSSGPQEPELKVCQVSGLVLLTPGESIRLRTIPKVRLKAERYLTYFGLFQVH